MSDMVNFSELISNAESCPEKLYNDNNEIEYDTELYQLIGTKDSNVAHVKIVGKSNGSKPVLKLNEFKILDDRFKCVLYQHVYLKSEISKTKRYKLLTFDVSEGDRMVCTLSFEFIYYEQNDSMSGRYMTILYKNNGETELDCTERYPGNSNIIEYLMKFISHEKVLDLFVE